MRQLQPKSLSLLLLLFCAALAGFGVLFSSSNSLAQNQVQLNAQVIRNFVRVNASGGDDLTLTSATKGTQIRLRFNQPVAVSSSALLQKLKPYVTSISVSDDKRSVLLTTNQPYRTREFVGSSGSGVDIIGITKTEAPAVEEVAQADAQPSPAPKEPSKKQPKSKVPPAIAKAKPRPQAKPVMPETMTVVDEVVSSTEADPAENLQSEPAREEAANTETPLSTEIEAPDVVAGAEETESEESIKAVIAVTDTPVTAQTFDAASRITVTELPDGVSLNFPFTKRVAMAAYQRGGHTYLLFNQSEEFDLSEVDLRDDLDGFTSVKHDEGNVLIYRFQSDYAGLSASKKTKSYHWQVTLLNKSQLPQKLIEIRPKTEPPLRPHLFIDELESAETLTITDSIIGDVLQVIPFYRAGLGVRPERRFVEFSMPATSQGIVIADAIAELRVGQTRNGIKITTPDGIMISQNLPPVASPEQALLQEETSDTFYPYSAWKLPETITVNEFMTQIREKASSNDIQTRLDARTRLAQYYLSIGFGREAATLLEMIAQDSPIYFTAKQLHSALAAAYFLSYDFLRAETALNHATLEDEQELAFFRDLTAIILRGEGVGDYLGNYQSFIQHYPPLLRQRMALISANHLINDKRYNAALKIFDTLEKSNMLAGVEDYVQFMIGRVLAATTQKDAARTIWQQLAAKIDNRFIRPRAQFALTNLDLVENKIGLQDAIDQLEPLRIIWRGDEFEISLLSLLGELYEETGQHREALRAMREIVTYYPNHSENFEITGEMADIFKRLFNEGEADNMSPLHALALYYEFRNLTPIGDAGDQMIRNLADRLVKVDLLDRAASLLQHQVEFRLSGQQRSKVGTQLALIHLFRHKPKEALKVLELTGYGANPKSLQQQRALLTARALHELEENDRALTLLEGDGSRAAKMLQISIQWDRRKWPEMIVLSEAILGERKDPTLPLAPDEVGVLMKLAIAYIFENQRDSLQYLRDYFLPLVTDERDREKFSFLADDTAVDYRNLSKLAKQIGRMESFLDNYRAKVKEEGLSEAVQ